MARTVLASEMLARLREATDTEGNTHVTDAELYKKLTSSVAATWDKLQAHGLGGEGVKAVTFNTVANQQEYALGTIVSAGDFFQVKTLYVNEGNGQYRPVNRVNPSEEVTLRPPVGVYQMKLYYVPAAPVFSTGSEVFDGINGWEEHVIQGAAIMVRVKQEDDTGPHRAQLREIEERMKVMANRNRDEAPRVIRRALTLRKSRVWAPYAGNVTGWDIRGANLELFHEFGCYV